MNLGELHKKLIAAARAAAPDDRVPYAFEKRIMARLVPAPRLDVWAVWSNALWKASAPCVAIMLFCGVWAMFDHSSSSKADFSQDFETAVFASASPDQAW